MTINRKDDSFTVKILLSEVHHVCFVSLIWFDRINLKFTS